MQIFYALYRLRRWSASHVSENLTHEKNGAFTKAGTTQAKA